MKFLTRAANGSQPTGPTTLLILDGVGEGDKGTYDCVFNARTPNLDMLRKDGVHTTLNASGLAVGLSSEDDMGNSEVGHSTMGAGRIFDQGVKVIDDAFASGEVWGSTWKIVISQIHARDSTLHVLGLLSRGRVHSDSTHLFDILGRAAKDDVKRIRVHALFDGRDVEDFTAQSNIEELEAALREYRSKGFDYEIASGGGRMCTTMDRYGSNWGIVEQGWMAHVLGTARQFESVLEALETSRAESPPVSDQLIPAFTIVDDLGIPLGKIKDGDVVLVFNFRGDRAIEFCRAIEDENFDHFDRKIRPDVLLVSMTQYERESRFPIHYLVEPPRIQGTVSELLAAAGVTQFACAESQKFGHITYFWNGNRSEPFSPSLEKYVEIPSDVVPFDQRPWMKSAETADTVIQELTEGGTDFLRVNFAAGDMVGHTADLEATLIAVESIDLAIGRIMKIVRERNGCLIVTSDHGNAEDMVEVIRGQVKRDGRGEPILKTAHSLNKVPFIIKDFAGRVIQLNDSVDQPGLANVGSTLIELLGFKSPSDFAPSLISIDAALAPNRRG